MRSVAPRIHAFEGWKREMLALARAAEADERLGYAFASFGAAEFFMSPDDSDRRTTSAGFVEIFDKLHAGEFTRVDVPYERGALPARSLRATTRQGMIGIFAGFDSFIEEFSDIARAVRDAGYDVVMFDGPGQGSALVKHGVSMTHAWEKLRGRVAVARLGGASRSAEGA